MATAALIPEPRFLATDPNGAPLAGGFVYTYTPNSTTPMTTWQDANQTTPNTNPIVLDAAGSALIYGAGTYQITVTDSFGNQIPAYSGLATANPTTAAISAVISAPTVLAAANLLLASGLTVPLNVMDGINLTGTSVPGLYNGAPAQLWFNEVVTTSSATLPEIGAQVSVTANTGGGNINTAEKVAFSAAISSGNASAATYGITSTVSGYGGTYLVVGEQILLNNLGTAVNAIGNDTAIYGLTVENVGNTSATCGILVTYASASWEYGVAVTGAVAAAYYDNSDAIAVIQSIGAHVNGIDFSNSTITGDAIALPNNAPIAQYDGGHVLRNVANINVDSGLIIGDPNLVANYSANSFLPTADNTYVLGNTGARWTAVWAATGTIQTSDPTLKTDIKAIPEALPLVNAIEPKTYKWKVGGKKPDGTDVPGKRTHWGFMAPEIKAAVDKTGLDFGGYVKDDAGIEHLRFDQLIPILWGAVRELSSKVEALENKNKG